MGCARESGPMPSSAPNSEDVVASVLTFLASEPERLARFFILTGLSPDTIRQAAATPGFAAAVFDYLLNDEPLLRLFTACGDRTRRAAAGAGGTGKARNICVQDGACGGRTAWSLQPGAAVWNHTA